MLKRKVHDYSTTPYTVSEETVHVGRSVFCKPETVQVMSDIWEEHMRLTSITPEGDLTVHSVSGWYGERDGEANEYEIDATPQAFADYRKRQYELAYRKYFADAVNAASDPAVKGRVVKIVRGRTAKGAVGRVVVVMTGNYSYGYRSNQELKLGVALSPEKVTVVKNGKTFENYANMVWVWARNVEVETPEPVNTVLVNERADNAAANLAASLQKIAYEAGIQYGRQNQRKAA